MISTRDRMYALLGESAGLAPALTARPNMDRGSSTKVDDATSINATELAKAIAAAVEAMDPKADPVEVVKVLRSLSMGKGATVMKSLIRRETTAKAVKSVRTTRKELM